MLADNRMEKGILMCLKEIVGNGSGNIITVFFDFKISLINVLQKKTDNATH